MSVQSFMSKVPGIVQAEVRKRSGDCVKASVCIAQAALESGWNENAKTLFGIKGSGVTLNTKEYLNGEWVTICAGFKNFDTIAEAVAGYYDLMEKARYRAAKNFPDALDQVDYIHKAGYATDPGYAVKVKKIIKKYDLTKYDVEAPASTNNLEQIAAEVIRGKWGNGSERMRRLTHAGYNYQEVQKLVNKMLMK